MRRILVIEDHPDMRQNICAILEVEGYEVRAVGNGADGVRTATEHPPDLVLCDIDMPVLDGYGVVKALRANPVTTAIPFIFLTAKGEKQDFREGMCLGADDYLTKPFSIDELISAIGTRFERHRALAGAMRTVGFDPDFTSAQPLETLGLTPREAQVLLWAAQGKTNSEISGILGAAEATIKKHMTRVMEKLGVENRNAATVVALDALCKPRT